MRKELRRACLLLVELLPKGEMGVLVEVGRLEPRSLCA